MFYYVYVDGRCMYCGNKLDAYAYAMGIQKRYPAADIVIRKV